MWNLDLPIFCFSSFFCTLIVGCDYFFYHCQQRLFRRLFCHCHCHRGFSEGYSTTANRGCSENNSTTANRGCFEGYSTTANRGGSEGYSATANRVCSRGCLSLSFTEIICMHLNSLSFEVMHGIYTATTWKGCGQIASLYARTAIW